MLYINKVLVGHAKKFASFPGPCVILAKGSKTKLKHSKCFGLEFYLVDHLVLVRTRAMLCNGLVHSNALEATRFCSAASLWVCVG